MEHQTLPVKIANVGSLLQKYEKRIGNLLPAHQKERGRRIMAAVMVCVQSEPKLADCSVPSLLGAVMTLARQGLTPGIGRADCFLVPFKVRGEMRCQILYDYRGLEKLARNSGQIKRIRAESVREGDTFAYELGTNEYVKHVPGPSGKRGELTHAWAFVETINGGMHLAVLDREEVEKIKASSRSSSGADSPWRNWEERQWRKSAIKRALNDAPQSDELMEALGNDGRVEAGKEQIFSDASFASEEPSGVTEAEDVAPVREPGEEG